MTRRIALFAVALVVTLGLSVAAAPGTSGAAQLEVNAMSWGRRTYVVYFSRADTNAIASVAGAGVAWKAAQELKRVPLYIKVGSTGTWSGVGAAVMVVLAANAVPAVAYAVAARSKGQCLIAQLSGTTWFVAPFAGWAYGPCLS